MTYYVLDTKAESDECRRGCYLAHISHHKDPDYVATTTEWSDEQIREDGKYIVPFCEHYSNPFDYLLENEV